MTVNKHKLQAEGLCKSYGGRQVVKGVSMSLDSGEVVGLLGPNGAGKTTSFYMIVGLVRPDSGQVVLDDTEVSLWPMYKRAAAGLAYLPQESSVFRKLSVKKNLLAVLEYHVADKLQREERLHELLEEFRLTHVADSPGYCPCCQCCRPTGRLYLKGYHPSKG